MRAFSVLELLVTIAVIAILLAVSLPALGHVRRVAQRVACEANIRSCSQALTCYARDHDDSLPMFAERRLLDAFTNGGYTLSYFYQSIHWPMVVRDYLTDRPLDEAQLCPSGPAFRTAFAGSGSYTTYLSDYPASYTQPSDYWLGYTMFTARTCGCPEAPSTTNGYCGRFGSPKYCSHRSRVSLSSLEPGTLLIAEASILH